MTEPERRRPDAAASRRASPTPRSRPHGEREGGRGHKHVTPLDIDGVRTVAAGTILWGVAFLALLPFGGALRERGDGWWLWTCAVGFAGGLVSLLYLIRRRNALTRDHASTKTSAPV